MSFDLLLARTDLRLLTHVKVSVRCLFKDDQFSLLVWLLLSLLFLCFHIQKQLILHALAINPSVPIELHLRISNMHHLIVGQVGIKIITSITGGEESNLMWRISVPQLRWKSQFCKQNKLDKSSNFTVNTKHTTEGQSQSQSCFGSKVGEGFRLIDLSF